MKIFRIIVLGCAVTLFASCKNDKSDYRQDDTENMTTTDNSDPPTAYKDTIVKPGDTVAAPAPEQDGKNENP